MIHTVKGFGIVNKAEIEIEFSFTWATMRVAAWEAASQIALRVLQSGSGGKSIYKVLVKGEFSAMKDSFYKRFPGSSDSKSVCLQCGRPGFDPWIGKVPWRRKWQPTPVFLPGESLG